MKPKMMEIVQTSQDALPTVAAIPPIENSTSTGTPLATQNAPVQSIFRCRPSSVPSAPSIPFAAVAVLIATPKGSQDDALPPHNHAACPERIGAGADRQLYALGPKWFSRRTDR